MTETLKKAKDILLSDTSLTCAACSGDDMFTSRERGVKPLLQLYESGKDYSKYSFADKVVGKAAAFMYVLLGVKEIYCVTVSELAADILKEHGVCYCCENIVPAIKNRRGDGLCPMETAVRNISEPKEALSAIRKKLADMQQVGTSEK